MNVCGVCVWVDVDVGNDRDARFFNRCCFECSFEFVCGWGYEVGVECIGDGEMYDYMCFEFWFGDFFNFVDSRDGVGYGVVIVV